MSLFDRNIAALQKALYSSGFIKKLQRANYTLVEQKNAQKNTSLKRLHLKDLPQPAWRVQLEKQKGIFGISGKKPEEALFFYTKTHFVVVLVEMKSSLGIKELRSLEAKFKSGLEKILSLLPIYIHGTDYANLKPLYIGLTAYQKGTAATLKRIKEDGTQKHRIYAPFLQAMAQSTPSTPIEKTIDSQELGRFKFHYVFYEEDAEEIEYSIQDLLKKLAVDVENIIPCPAG